MCRLFNSYHMAGHRAKKSKCNLAPRTFPHTKSREFHLVANTWRPTSQRYTARQRVQLASCHLASCRPPRQPQNYYLATLLIVAALPRIVNLDRFHDEIVRRILRDYHSHNDIIYFLQGEGVTISRNTLKARLKQWGITRRHV